jgi:TM2 domain-containing membrane protein YozV
MFCIRCGTQLNEGTAFCSRCGARVSPVTEQVAGVVAPPQATGQVSTKSRLATSLLAWFLGSFGAHRFYTGKIGTAVVMLMITILAYAIMICAFVGMFAVMSDEYWPAPFVAGVVLSWLLHMAVWVWMIIDFIVAVTGNFKDNQGRVIKKW